MSATSLFVNLAAVCNPRHADYFRRVVDDVHYAPVTDADAPLIFVALQLPASRGPGVVGQCQNLPVYAAERPIVERIQFLCAVHLISREYLTTRAGAFQASGAVLLVRIALFLPARFGHKAVPEVLPDGPMFFQVD